MEQLELAFTGNNNLEKTVNVEFSRIMGVWDACHYAKDNDPCPGIKYYGRYYTPRTIKETKETLIKLYPMSARNIRKMTAKQAKMVYHKIMKYLSSQ